MIFVKPKASFREAMQANEVRSILPLDLDSALIAEIDPEILLRSRFSAKVESARHLGALHDAVEQFTAGKIGWVEAKKTIRQSIEHEGYIPDPEHRGGLQDLSSDARITLQLRTNVQQAQGYGHWKQGQSEGALMAYPAQEFRRVESREKPRENWGERFLAAGGPKTGAWPRMIALKNDPCWIALSRFGTPYPPYDFGSGMGVRDISFDEAVSLGLLSPGQGQQQPQDLGFNDDLHASPGTRSQVLRSALESTGVGYFDTGGVFRAITGGNTV